MNTNIAWAAVILVFLGIVGMTFFIAIAGNVSVMHPRRQALAQRVRWLRFHRRLERQQVDVDDYIEQTSVANLKRQIQACEDCAQVVACEEALAAPEGETPDFSFCPNEPVEAPPKHERE